MDRTPRRVILIKYYINFNRLTIVQIYIFGIAIMYFKIISSRYYMEFIYAFLFIENRLLGYPHKTLL